MAASTELQAWMKQIVWNIVAWKQGQGDSLAPKWIKSL